MEKSSYYSDNQQKVFHMSYNNRHMLADNLNQRSGLVAPMSSFYNADHCVTFVVLQGSLNLRVNGLDIVLRPNDFLSVMPCATLEVLESRCIFFSHAAQAHTIFDLYETVNFDIPMQKRAFSLRMYHFTASQIEHFKAIYLMLKREMLRPDYPVKEHSLRAITKLNLVALLESTSAAPLTNVTPYLMTNPRKLFEQFIDLLDAYYTHERSVQFYSKRLGVSAKYLSMITQSIVGKSASVVISQYVAFRVKQLLYRGQLNVKQIGELLNFPTQSFFGRYFKRIVGSSPRQYMKENCRTVTAKPSKSSKSLA